MVPRESALLHGQEEVPICVERNHSDLAKFISTTDGTYCELVYHLKKEVDSIAKDDCKDFIVIQSGWLRITYLAGTGKRKQ